MSLGLLNINHVLHLTAGGLDKVDDVELLGLPLLIARPIKPWKHSTEIALLFLVPAVLRWVADRRMVPLPDALHLAPVSDLLSQLGGRDWVVYRYHISCELHGCYQIH